MNDFESINSIISDAVQNSSYITVLISSCVFIIYTLTIRVVDLVKTKNRNKPLIEMANSIKQVSENVVKLNNVLDKTFKNAELKEERNITNIINLSFDSFKTDISDYCSSIVIHNNIEENKELIIENIYRYISTEYYKLYSLLSTYEIDNINIATKLEKEWIEELKDECINIIYDKQDKIIRISQLTNKIKVISNGYSVHIINKVFNH